MQMMIALASAGACILGVLTRTNPSSAVALVASSVCTLYVFTRVVALESKSDLWEKREEHELEDRVAKLEEQLKVLQRRLVPSSAPRNPKQDQDYVTVEQKSLTYVQKHPDIAGYSAQDVIDWVERILGGAHGSEYFHEVDGPALLDMYYENEHGFSIGDKCFFMGLDRQSCAQLEQALTDALKSTS